MKHSNTFRIDKSHVSEHDKLFHRLHKQFPSSASQQQEQRKFEALYQLRDGKRPEKPMPLLKRLLRIFCRHQ